jgi:hypothetical protein
VDKVLGASTLPLYIQPEIQFKNCTDETALGVGVHSKSRIRECDFGPSQKNQKCVGDKKDPQLRKGLQIQKFLLSQSHDVLSFSNFRKIF